ncbi:hypothetical protein JCM10296v2_000496 [Rhodotorula toruloides]
MAARRRSGSLELDYGDSAYNDIDLIGTDFPMEHDVVGGSMPHSYGGGASTSANGGGGRAGASVDGAQQQEHNGGRAGSGRPEAHKSTLPAAPGLPANPLTGVRPGGGSASPASPGGAPGALPNSALFIGDLHWYTSDADIVYLAQLAGVPVVELKDVSFSEHKVNGKSKGVCYVECHSAENAQRLKQYIDNNEYQDKKMLAQIAPGGTGVSPFKTLPKEPARAQNVPHSNIPRVGGIAVRPPPSVTTAYMNPHPGQNRRDQQPGAQQNQQGGRPMAGLPVKGGAMGNVGMRMAGPPLHANLGGGGGGMGQQQPGGMGMHFGGGAGAPGAGMFNPAFGFGAGAGAPNGGAAGAGGFDMSAFGGMGMMPLGGMGMGMMPLGGMPGFGMGAMGMPDFSGMNAFGIGGMGAGMCDGAHEGQAKKRTRTDG